MKRKKEVVFFAIAILAALISFYFDSKIVFWISLIRNNFLNDFFLGLTFLSSEIIIFFFLTSLFLWSENKRRWILPLWLTLFLSAAIGFLLKVSVQRMRPFELGVVETLPVLIKSSYNVWNFSFPSFQSMLVFCAIPILAIEFKRFKKIWVLFAVLVAFSRVYFGVHFMSDVISGGILGYAIGLFIVRFEREKKFGEKYYKKIFRK